MDYRFLSQKEISPFIHGLLKSYNVFGPVLKDGFPMYEEIDSPDEVQLLHTPTHLPPKQYLFPQKETLARFLSEDTKEGGLRIEQMLHAEEQVLLGVHSCDIHAIRLLDRVFAYGTPDPNYLTRREKTLIIGVDCMPDEYCFCKSVETMSIDSGFDLFFHDIGKGFLIRIGTEKGKTLLAKYAKARMAKTDEIKKLDTFRKKRADAFVTRINTDAAHLPLIYSNSYDSPVWEKIGKICYGCGSCNFVCPTCYCFDVKDDMAVNLKSGERYRTWDACLLEEFAKVAGGHNFRKTRAERLRHRFNRKFQYLVDRFGGLFCVGCGRCIRTCLVDINIAEVTNELIEESKRSR